MARIKSLAADESAMVQIHVAVPRDTEKWLAQTSKDSECSLSAVVRDALKLYIRAHDKENPLAKEFEKESKDEQKVIAKRNKGTTVKTSTTKSLCPRGYDHCYAGGCKSYASCESPIKILTDR